jgi:ribose transport system substrate-binding protein
MKKSLVLFLTVLFVFTGALAVFAGSKTDGKKAEKIKVGFLVLDLTNPYWNTQAEGAKAKAAEYDNLELIIVDGQSDPAREINAVENWTTQGVDGIMLSAIDAEAVAPYLKRAKEKGIYVVGAIHPVPAVDLDASLTLDEYNFGYMAGTEAGKWINNKLGGKAKCAILAYDNLAHVIARGDGIRDGILDQAPNAKIVVRQDAYLPDMGMKVIEAALQAHPDLKVIQGINDSGALGAYEAVRAAGKDTPDFWVGGNDATHEGLEKIKEGGIYKCSVDISPYPSGQIEVEMMMNLINGVEFERYQKVPMVAVMSNNVDEYLARYENQ